MFERRLQLVFADGAPKVDSCFPPSLLERQKDPEHGSLLFMPSPEEEKKTTDEEERDIAALVNVAADGAACRV